MVALDKMSGQTVWVAKELSDEAGYASAIVADVQGVRTIMTLTGEAGVGVRAVGRQADVASEERGQRHRQHRDADLFRQQGVLHVGVRHRRGAARVDGARRRGQGAADLLHARDAEPSRRRRAGGRLSVRLQQLDSELPEVFDRRDDVAATAASGRARSPTPMVTSTCSARTTSSAWPRRCRAATRKRAGSRLPTRVCRAGRIRS